MTTIAKFQQAATGAVNRDITSKLAEFVSVKDFGAVGDGVTDDSAAIQSAIDYCQGIDQALALEPGKRYRLDTGLVFKHGRSATDTKSYSVRLIGNGAALYPSGSQTAITITPRCSFADRGTGRGEAHIHISDVVVDGFYGPNTAAALTIGAWGFWCSSLSWSQIQTFTVQNFNPGRNVVLLYEARHAVFDALCVRNGITAIYAASPGSFCGDIVFHACEFTGTVASPPINISTPGTNTEVRGLTFSSCDIYGSGTIISSTGTNSFVGDIWFTNGTQFDGPAAPAGEHALRIFADNTGRVFQIHVLDVYFVSYTGAAVFASKSGSGDISILTVKGGGINNCTTGAGTGSAMLFFLNVQSASVRDVEFDSITGVVGSAYINFDGCNNVVCHNNKGTRSSTVEYGIAIGNSSNNYSIMGNVMNVGTAVINDYTSGSPTRQVLNNLRI